MRAVGREDKPVGQQWSPFPLWLHSRSAGQQKLPLHTWAPVGQVGLTL